MVRQSEELSRSLTDINVTPLIDVMLVLLIILIISLPPITHAVKIDNPPPSIDPPPVKPRVVVNLGIDFDGAASWNGTRIDRQTLRSYIAAQAADDPQAEVQISVDRFTKYASIAETLADLQSRGLRRIGFINSEV